MLDVDVPAVAALVDRRSVGSSHVQVAVRLLVPSDIEAVVALSLRAWAPVDASFEKVLGAAVHRQVYPDWPVSQAAAVEGVCRREDTTVWIAADGPRPVGFVAVVFAAGGRSAEITMLAVDPAAQGRGIGTALTEFAVARIRDAGVPLVEVATGGDPAHAPARRTYEKAGFVALPLVRYYRKL